MENTNKWKHPVFMDCKINIFKMSILPKAIYRFKIPMAFFTEIEKEKS